MPLSLTEIAATWWLNIAIVLPAYLGLSIGVWLTLWVVLRRRLARRRIRAEVPPARQLISELLHSCRSIAVFATASLAVSLRPGRAPTLWPISRAVGGRPGSSPASC